MRRVAIGRLKPGMVVGLSLYNARGDVLLSRGLVLTSQYIASLKEIDVPALYIDDGFLPGLEVSDVAASRIRAAAVVRLRESWSRKTGPVVTLDKEDAEMLRHTVAELLEETMANQSVMVNLADIRSQDDYLFAHSVNVCVLALMTGVFLGLERSHLFTLGLGSLLHDIGKLVLPQEVLNKPGKLDQDEFELVKHHSRYSYEIISSQKDAFGDLAATIALQHHERYNGRGYPAGLAGREINELAQVVGIADVYDAMTADRIYRPAHSPNDVYEMLAASGDHHFEFRLVRAFLRNIAAYPGGSLVQLNSGETAVVVATSKAYPLYPKVKVIFDRHGCFLQEPYEMALSNEVNLCITRVLEDEEVEKLKSLVIDHGKKPDKNNDN